MQTVIDIAPRSRTRPLGRVLVTGGASLIGSAIADAVARAGGTPISFDIKQLRDEADRDHRIVDPADPAAIEAAVTRVAGEYGGIDAVVALAGVDTADDFERARAQGWERVTAAALVGTAALVRAALPYLERARNPRIVMVASACGLRDDSIATACCTSKFGIVGFTRALAVDVGGRVGVTLLSPADMKAASFGHDAQFRPAPDPDRIAETIVFALTRQRGVELRELIVTASRTTAR